MNRKFKKFLSAVLAVIMVLSTVPVMSYALEEGVVYKYDAVDDPLGYIECYYDIYKGKARICSYSQPKYSLFTNSNLDQETIDETIEKYKTVIIPETINGYEVGYIQGCAFYFLGEETGDPDAHSTLFYAKELIFSDTIVYIGDYILCLCDMQKIVLPNNPDLVFEWGETFESCNIGEIILPQKVKSLEMTLGNCNVSKIIVPGNIKDLNLILGLCTIDEIVVDEGVEDIALIDGDKNTLKKIYLPQTLTSFSCSSVGVNIETLYYSGTRADWGNFDLEYEIETEFKENGTEFVYKSIVENIDITPDVLEIYSGKSETLTTNIAANTTDTSFYTVTYTSSDEDVAKVDENGKITAYGRGAATITCTVTDDNGHTVSDTCEVTVKYTFWRWLLRVFLYIIGVNSKI